MISWFSSSDASALLLSLKLASINTLLLLLLTAPLAWWLARTRCRLRPVIEAVVALPLILPPTVLGFYLLLFLGPNGWGGQLMQLLGGHPLTFSFAGLVVASMIYSLPFAVQPLQNAFQSAGGRNLEVAATLRAGPVDRFFSVTLPLARRGIITAAVLVFAHTLGEFGVILMIGGNIPDVTQVASIAIYDHVEALDYSAAHGLSIILVAIAFTLLLGVYTLNRRFRLLGACP